MKCPNCEYHQIEIGQLSRGVVKGKTQVKGCPECLHVWVSDSEGIVKIIQQGYESNFDIAA